MSSFPRGPTRRRCGTRWSRSSARSAGCRPVSAARDTLRTEMGYPLHGQDLSLDISPLQARLSWAVGWKKPRFWGRTKPRRREGSRPGAHAVGHHSRSTGASPRPHMRVLDAAGRHDRRGHQRDVLADAQTRHWTGSDQHGGRRRARRRDRAGRARPPKRCPGDQASVRAGARALGQVRALTHWRCRRPQDAPPPGAAAARSGHRPRRHAEGADRGSDAGRGAAARRCIHGRRWPAPPSTSALRGATPRGRRAPPPGRPHRRRSTGVRRLAARSRNPVSAARSGPAAAASRPAVLPVRHAAPPRIAHRGHLAHPGVVVDSASAADDFRRLNSGDHRYHGRGGGASSDPERRREEQVRTAVDLLIRHRRPRPDRPLQSHRGERIRAVDPAGAAQRHPSLDAGNGFAQPNVDHPHPGTGKLGEAAVWVGASSDIRGLDVRRSGRTGGDPGLGDAVVGGEQDQSRPAQVVRREATLDARPAIRPGWPTLRRRRRPAARRSARSPRLGGPAIRWPSRFR